MMTKKRSRDMAAALALSAVMGLAHAAPAAPLVEPPRVALTGAPRSPETVRLAIAKAGGSQGWAVAAEEPGRLTLSFDKQGRHRVTVQVIYDGEGYQIAYLDSVNMKLRTGTAGERVIHPNYNTWVARLGEAIAAQLAR